VETQRNLAANDNSKLRLTLRLRHMKDIMPTNQQPTPRTLVKF
jgi:hypothetical protein